MPTKTKPAPKSAPKRAPQSVSKAKPAPKAANNGRTKGQTQISISLSKPFLVKIDQAAGADNRNRSNWITVKLKEAVDRELR